MKTVSTSGKVFDIVSSNAVVPVLVEYQYEDSHDIRKAVAYVNYGNDSVYFPNNPELDTDVVRRAVLAGFDTNFPAKIQIPKEVFEQIEQIRSGNYGVEIPGFRSE